MSGYYLFVKPQLRMFTSNSLPVRMPTYRVLLGTQHLFKLPQKNEKPKERYYGFGFESGHYSNGQSGCAFSSEFEDATDECLNIYAQLTPESDLSSLLNREDGNFSTNLTKLTAYYQVNQLRPDGNTKEIHTLEFNYTTYHNRFLWVGNFGGYSPEDIEIYGRHRFELYYAFTFFRRNETEQRIRLSERLFIIQGAHEHVNALRSETQFTVFPFRKTPAFGFLARITMGHDNYNYRFVDSGTLISGGITWDLFPPIKRPNQPSSSSGRTP